MASKIASATAKKIENKLSKGVKGSHEENLEMIDALCGRMSFNIEPGYDKIINGETWPDVISNISYDNYRGESTDEKWYHTLKYALSTREAQFVVLPYSTIENGKKKFLFVAYQYDAGLALTNHEKKNDMLKICPYDLAEKGEFYELEKDDEKIPCCWYFGFTPSRLSLLQNTLGVDTGWANCDIKYKEDAFRQLFLVFKPCGMRLYQKRFRSMIEQAKSTQVLKESKYSKTMGDAKDDAKAAVKEYVTECWKAVQDESYARLNKDEDNYDKNKGFANKGFLASIANIIHLVDIHINKENNGSLSPKGKEITDNLLGDTFKDLTPDKLFEKTVGELGGDDEAYQSVVTSSFSWLDDNVFFFLDNDKCNWLSEGGKELLGSIPFLGLGAKLGFSALAKLAGHYLRPMVSKKTWNDKSFLRLVLKVDKVYEAIDTLTNENKDSVLKVAMANGQLTYVELEGVVVKGNVCSTEETFSSDNKFYVAYYSQSEEGYLHPVFIHKLCFMIDKLGDDAKYDKLEKLLKENKMTTIDISSESGHAELGKTIRRTASSVKHDISPRMGCGITRYGQLFFAIYPHKLKDKSQNLYDLEFKGIEFSDLVNKIRGNLLEKESFFFNRKPLKIKTDSWYKARDFQSKVKGEGTEWKGNLLNDKGSQSLCHVLFGENNSAQSKSFSGSLDQYQHEASQRPRTAEHGRYANREEWQDNNRIAGIEEDELELIRSLQERTDRMHGTIAELDALLEESLNELHNRNTRYRPRRSRSQQGRRLSGQPFVSRNDINFEEHYA